ncbi:hypothetical protein [Agathobacter rectalis]|uniref:hypothetical protein n=1 Tax=Agathobacter rectalis TaxID=39491 RepID=UPI0036F1B071
MKKGRFLWSAHRITERQKAGKARNIKGKQLKNSRSTVSKQLVELLSSQRDNFSEKRISRVYYTSELRFWGVFCVNYDKINIIIKRK